MAGIITVKTGGAFAKGGKVTSNVSGQAVAIDTGNELNGYALEASTGSGLYVPILLK